MSDWGVVLWISEVDLLGRLEVRFFEPFIQRNLCSKCLLVWGLVMCPALDALVGQWRLVGEGLMRSLRLS